MGRHTFIHGGRNRKVTLGTLKPGTSVALRSTTPEGGEGCKSGKWYAVEPSGYICEDLNTTLDLDSELFRALAAVAPRRDATLPYSYGYSTGAPMYGRIPTADESNKIEQKFLPLRKLKLPPNPSGHMELATTEPPSPTGPVPFFFAQHRQAPLMPWQKDGLVRKTIREGNLLSFQGAVVGEGGRLFLLATNLTAVPADRIWPFKPSSFHGFEIDAQHAAPVGWTRRHPRPRFKQQGEAFVEDGSFGPRTAVWLTGKTVEQGGQSYVETREAGVWARAADLSIVDKMSELPKGVEATDRWIDVSLSQGTLTLYAGTSPVYTTLMSPGAGGTTPRKARKVEDLLAGAFTPLGLNRVSFKYRTAVMTPEDTPEPEKTWIDDVPYILYFRPPFAIHTAYWHEDFGMPKSGGCVNLSPIDARYVFDWSSPRIPDDWHGVSGFIEDPQGGTKIFLRQ